MIARLWLASIVVWFMAAAHAPAWSGQSICPSPIYEDELRRKGETGWVLSSLLSCVSQESADWAARHHHSASIRVVAVRERVTDQALLSESALRDRSRDVRIEAIKKLEVQPVLEQIAASTAREDERSEAILRLQNQSLIELLALDHREPTSVRAAALQVVKNEGVLASAFCEKGSAILKEIDASFLHLLFDRMNDQVALNKVVWSGSIYAVRFLAARRLRNQAMLAAVVMKHREAKVQAAAAPFLTEPSLAATVALEHPDPDIRGVATHRVTDQSVLVRIVGHDPDPTVRSTAAHRISDQEMLRRFARDPNVNMRHAAATNIDDEEELRRLVETDELKVALTAVARVRNQDLLLKWAKTHPEGLIRWEAIQGLRPEVDRDPLVIGALGLIRDTPTAGVILKASSEGVRQAAFDSASAWTREAALEVAEKTQGGRPEERAAKMAEEDPAPRVRIAALQRMQDPIANERAAKADSDSTVRQYAATRFPTNHPVRLNTALADPDPGLRQRLAETIREPGLARQLLERSRDAAVRRIAISSVADVELVKSLSKTDADPLIRKAAEERLKALERKR